MDKIEWNLRSIQMSEKWVMEQKWEDLLFIHLPVAEDAIKRLIPNRLEVDLYKGMAWISLVIFRIRSLRFRHLPSIPFFRSFLELNIRTYVKRGEFSGVYFFSLDANHLPAVIGAQILALPYYLAEITISKKDGKIHFTCKRKGKDNNNFSCSYHPVEKTYKPLEGSLEHWLMERYYLWSNRKNDLYMGNIHHTPWGLQQADVKFQTENFLPTPIEKSIVGNPVFHYVPYKHMLAYRIKKIE